MKGTQTMTPNFVNQTAVTIATDLTSLKNGQLNHLLGEDGHPKYSDSQMKGKTKNQLADELLSAWHDWNAAHPAPKRARKNEGVADRPKSERTGAAERVSKNVKCAASKKCNLIKAYVANKKTREQVITTYEADPVLQAYWPIDRFEADMDAALKGTRPAVTRGKMVQLTLDLD